MKRKLRLRARIVRGGGVRESFRTVVQRWAGREAFEGLKVPFIHLVGPIAGLLFISTEKLAFSSERSLRFTTSTGEFIREPYKVFIPLKKIKRAAQMQM
ncbi:hypothetical protein Sjap_018365 [Stephania japonica]|uniref:Uncharacterized protein n=1 Tax=Stephania japonica TaxID=461633 RepID=A0AAP0NLG5_9MAGN